MRKYTSVCDEEAVIGRVGSGRVGPCTDRVSSIDQPLLLNAPKSHTPSASLSNPSVCLHCGMASLLTYSCHVMPCSAMFRHLQFGVVAELVACTNKSQLHRCCIATHGEAGNFGTRRTGPSVWQIHARFPLTAQLKSTPNSFSFFFFFFRWRVHIRESQQRVSTESERLFI